MQEGKYTSETTKGIYQPLKEIFKDGEKVEKMTVTELLQAADKMNEIELEIRAEEAEAMLKNEKIVITGIKH